MAKLPNSVVAQTSQGLYNAVASANLSPEESGMVTQLSYAYQEGLRLSKLSPANAKLDFNNLNDNAKKDVRVLFPNEEYSKPEQGLAGKALDIAGKVVSVPYKFFGSPFLGTFSALEKYGKTLNTPVRVGFEATTLDKPVFSQNTWSDAYKGKDFYNPNDVKNLEEKYGKANAAVAMGIASGKTPGEIVKSWGKVDAEITQALADSLDDPDKFEPILKETKLARFSPGRSLIRMVYDEKHPVLSTLWFSAFGRPIEVPGQSAEVKAANEAYKANVMAKQSGVIDAIYQVIISPDTYLTMGLSKIPLIGPKLARGAIARGADEAGFLVAGQGNKGRVLADKILAAKPEELNLTVRETFQRPDVFGLWQNEVGPVIKAFAEAEGNTAKAQIFRNFRLDYPEFNDLSVFKLYVKNNVFDAASAEKFFTTADNARYLIGGRLDGTTFYRNGIATARGSRWLTAGKARWVDAIFNPTVGNIATRDTIEKATVEHQRGWEILTSLGEGADVGVNPNIKKLVDIENDISKTRKLAFKIGRAAGRSPTSGIRYGDDAVLTVSEFRNLAALVIDRDFADTWALNYLDSDSAQQVVAIRNLYAAYFQKQGFEGLPGGKDYTQKILDKTFNNHAGFGVTSRVEIRRDLADMMDPSAIEVENGVPYLRNRGITHGFQAAGMIAPLPFEEIAATKAMLGMKDEAGHFTLRNGIPSLFDGMHRNYYMRAAVDTWAVLTLGIKQGLRTSIDHFIFYAFNVPLNAIKDLAIGESRKLGKVLTVATGSKAAVGPYKRLFNKLFLNGGLEERLTKDDRLDIVRDLQKDLSEKLGYDVPMQEVSNILITQETGKRAFDIVFKGQTNKAKQDIIDLFVYQPDSIDAMQRAVSAKSNLSGRFDDEFRNLTLPESTVTRAVEESGLKLGRKWEPVSTRDLAKINQKFPALAHFDNWALRFAFNTIKLADYKFFSPVSAFFMHNGLRDTKDIERARRSILKQVGVNYYSEEDQAIQLANRTINSGGALGADTVFGREGAVFGMNVKAHSFDGHKIQPGSGTQVIHTQQELEVADDLMKTVNEKYLKRAFPPTNKYVANLLRRNYYQVKDSEAVVAIGRIDNNVVQGGTAWAVYAGIELNKPVHVFDMNVNKWFTWVDGTWSQSDTIPAYRDFAGIGSRDISPAGARAVKEYLTNMALIKPGISLKVFDADLLKRFNNKFGDTVASREKGLPEEKIALVLVDNMLADMQVAFHGGANSFNQELMNLVKEKHFDITEAAAKRSKRIPSDAWEKAVSSIEFSDFEKVTVNMHPSGEVNTRINFIEKNMEGNFKKFGNAVYEQADREATGLFSQPALVYTYVNLRQSYRNQERLFAKQQEARLLEQDPFNSKAKEIAEDLARKRYTELAHNDAIYTVLKYIDNPAIRSNFSMSVRHVGRFYRATEDFYRRYYRMLRDKPVQTAYRMRLLHQGLQSSGGIHRDQDGVEYFIFPTDAIINGAVEPVVRKLSGDNQFKVPQFDNFKVKLQMLNPSFSPDSGIPTFSSPAASVTILAIDGLLGKYGNAFTANLGEDFKKATLGSFGETMSFHSAIVPLYIENAIRLSKPAQEVFGITDIEHKSREEKSAAMQAISYMQAYGNQPLPENPTPQERNDYLKAISISTSNLLFMRGFLGMFSPASAALQESKGVPDYYKQIGITSLRSEFYDILDGIKQTYGTDIQDAYALATAIFVANNPKKSIYLASRNDKQTNILINKTQEVKDWALSNKDFINTYGETAYIFAPKVGEFNPAVYNWLESQDLLGQPDLEVYLERVLVAEDKAAYFNIARKEDEALANTPDITLRQSIITASTAQRQALLNSNPYLLEALQSKNNFPSEKIMLENLSTLLSDANTPIPDITRVKMRAAVNEVEQFVALSTDQEFKMLPNFTEIKRQRKYEIERLLNDLRTGDLAMFEAYRAVLQPILDFYSRDTYVALRKAN